MRSARQGWASGEVVSTPEEKEEEAGGGGAQKRKRPGPLTLHWGGFRR